MNMPQQEPDKLSYLNLIELARREDMGSGDVTSEITISETRKGRAAVVFRQPGVLCGLPVAREVLRRYDADIKLEAFAQDGQHIAAGIKVAAVTGPLRPLFAAERVVLNFLQRLSGVATLTAAYVERVRGTSARICDTRKTTPGWRELEKYAVRCGGGLNHRRGLYDAVLIKDNHLAALGGANLREGLLHALAKISRRKEKPAFVEVEVDTLDQMQQVLEVPGVDMILLDNMAPDQLAQAVRLRNAEAHTPKILLEASGGITLDTVRDIALSGVDRISVGALTHSAAALDIAFDLE